MTTSGALRSRSFRAMLAASFCGFGGFSLLLPVVPLWADEGGSGRFGAGATTAVFMLVTVLTQLAVPGMMRRFGQRWVLVGGMVMIGLPAPLFAISSDLALLLGVSVLRGVGFGMLTVAGSALVAELVPPEAHSRAAAHYGIAVGAPLLVLVPAGVGLVDLVDFEPLFFVAGALSLLGMVLALFVDDPAGVPDPAGSTPDMQRRWVAPWIAMFTCSVAQGGLITFVPLARPDDGALVAGALFATTAAALIGRMLAGEIGNRMGHPGRLLIAGVPVAAVGMVLAALVATAPGVPAGTGLVIGALLVGLGFGVVQNDSLVLMFVDTGSKGIGAASAAWNIAYDTGTGVGAAALGAIAQPTSFEAAFAASAGLLVATTVLTLRARPG